MNDRIDITSGAARAGVSVRTIERSIEAGALHVSKIGTLRHLEVAELDRWISQRDGQPPVESKSADVSNWSVRVGLSAAGESCGVCSRDCTGQRKPLWTLAYKGALVCDQCMTKSPPDLAAILNDLREHGAPASDEFSWSVIHRDAAINKAMCPIVATEQLDSRGRFVCGTASMRSSSPKQVSVAAAERVAPNIAAALHRHYQTAPAPAPSPRAVDHAAVERQRVNTDRVREIAAAIFPVSAATSPESLRRAGMLLEVFKRIANEGDAK